MQSKEARKEVIRKFKERKPLPGAFALRCTTTGQVWVGASRNLDGAKNGSWFCLRNGCHYNKSLQAEWDVRGEPTFQYEILDMLDEDVHPLEIEDLLKEKKTYWMARLGAQSI